MSCTCNCYLLFPVLPLIGLWYVIVTYPGYTCLLFILFVKTNMGVTTYLGDVTRAIYANFYALMHRRPCVGVELNKLSGQDVLM